MSSKQNLKQIRSLTLALFFSGTVNLLLVAFIFFWAITDRPPTPYCEVITTQQKQTRVIASSPSNTHVIKAFNALPYELLITKLKKKALVEDGFTERDLSLAVLVTYYDFDIEKALGHRAGSVSKRLMSLDQGKESVQVFPGLTEEDFEAISTYMETEKWPFKSRGLFQFLKKEAYADDPSLKEAFSLTKEYQLVESLFKGLSVDKEAINSLIAEGDYLSLSALCERIRKKVEPVAELRQRFLLPLIQNGSKLAAETLLRTDYEFSLKRLSDSTVEKIVAVLEASDPESLRYLTSIAASPRSDAIKNQAIKKYEFLAGKKWEPLVSRSTPAPKPLPVQPKIAAFKPEKPVPKPLIAQAKPVKDSLYIVQDGDTLWKIAKKYKISADRLRAYNRLKSDSLKPGTPLKIPQ